MRSRWLAALALSLGCAAPESVDPGEADLASGLDPYPIASVYTGGTGLGFGVSCTATAARRREDQIAAAERDAWDATGGGSPEAWMTLANCDRRCADEMAARDAACAMRAGPEQYPCLVESHHVQELCVAACEADLEATAADEQLATVANACARKLGAQREQDSCAGRPQRAYTDVYYRTAGGLTTHTCFAYTPAI